MPQAKLTMIDGVGHDLTLTAPDKVADVLLNFFGRRPAPSRA